MAVGRGSRSAVSWSRRSSNRASPQPHYRSVAPSHSRTAPNESHAALAESTEWYPQGGPTLEPRHTARRGARATGLKHRRTGWAVTEGPCGSAALPEGHAFPLPTIRFHGGLYDGMRALGLAIERGLPVSALHRLWTVIDREPTGPHWELVFLRKAEH